ncbi:amidase [Gymnodinialimonas sp.]
MAEPSALALRDQLADGSLAARTVADACLDHIAAREAELHAFAHLNPDYVRAQADALDAHRKAGRPLGPLHGVPVALKDIIDTADYPTENGSALDAGRRPAEDAVLVARLRAAGALIVGKTVSTEFAFIHPGPTRNPHNLAHTPGGSSQGSAAAVGAGMVPLALGSQTAGSTIRPASFCGTVGFKPTHARVPMTGVLPVAPPLDTIGAFALSVADAALLIDACQGYCPVDRYSRDAPLESLVTAARATPPVPPRFAIVAGPDAADLSPDVTGLLDEMADFLGDRADRVDLPAVFANAEAAHWQMMVANYARNLRHYRERGEAAISETLLAALDEGAKVSAMQYLSALDWQAALLNGILPIFERYDAIMTPATMGEAPASLDTTGDSRPCRLWTFLGTPAITIPAGKGSSGMPIGIQLVGRKHEDGRLLRTAAWLEAALRSAA